MTDRINKNKISLDVKKAELVVFKQEKKRECLIRMKLSRKRLLEEKARKTSVKYLGAQTDENLN